MAYRRFQVPVNVAVINRNEITGNNRPLDQKQSHKKRSQPKSQRSLSLILTLITMVSSKKRKIKQIGGLSGELSWGSSSRPVLI